MKIFKSPQNILILFLTVLVIISSIFIIRLEGKTAYLQSRLEEHHKSLEKNRDILDNLESFSRMIKNSGISIDGNKVMLQSGQSTMTLQNNNIDISSNGDIAIGTPTKSFVHIQKDGNIEIGPSNNKNLGYSKNEDFIYMYYKGSRIILGEQSFLGGKKSQGMRIVSNSGGDPPQIYVVDDGILLSAKTNPDKLRIQLNSKSNKIEIIRGESVVKLENENIEVKAKGDIEIGPSDDKNLGYSKNEDFIYMYHKGSRIILGEQSFKGGKKSQGMRIVSNSGGDPPQIYVVDDGILLSAQTNPDKLRIQLNSKSNVIEIIKGESSIKLEKDNIHLLANGDINISSKNGNVNINGKKVRLNE